MLNSDISNYLGLMKKAQKIITGESLVLESIKKKKALLVLITSDMGSATRKKITDKCNFYKVMWIEVGSTLELSNAIGQKRSVIAITDRGFTNGLLKKIE
ncbi:L7Ae/L30e/S12e/Gadd45 family ribosomal protein [Pediococcus claussenii]|uniref:Ribosomal L7Ae/L30e/S12e/Gadd45 family protein n=1 Tax=Pediococcus claussenii (strain ATCC BAA-344 / DSM 14800 / JCM 18046 / KCTC 3811 / LMG 21948 / P06) TaxID=701521 RepID=G8PDB4_PEDCP|nr:ribosomal L7Ae/L30e/S12e/Gadd45 family protein [Pediococcus claussenii]AEV95249.1 ribosomal L7Ae/L30e/S12e/Gadd45 family protein [Pediococcus claussenii ATCC BAA-344]ANZ70478.1 50S ribosomal protein L7 [Pediococcus claussenii]ANZ72293.1 50S ribosomal protein L7 [Pediococcus claussenii]KRN19569.1 hypothetical protein IV79_GL001286 [Pediococcus claussenii]